MAILVKYPNLRSPFALGRVHLKSPNSIRVTPCGQCSLHPWGPHTHQRWATFDYFGFHRHCYVLLCRYTHGNPVKGEIEAFFQVVPKRRNGFRYAYLTRQEKESFGVLSGFNYFRVIPEATRLSQVRYVVQQKDAV